MVQGAFENAGDTDWEKRKIDTHQRLLKDTPDLVSNTSPLALGSQGIVLDRGDGTLIKIYLRDKEAINSNNEKSFLNEVEILDNLKGEKYGTAYTPKILEVIPLPNSIEAHGAYCMPKFKGHHLQWKIFAETANSNKVKTHFRNVGKVLADFHTKAAPSLLDRYPEKKRLEYGTSIKNVPILNQKINQALDSCNAHLQQHMKSGVNHGDFNEANFLVNEEGETTVLLDPSFAGYTPNYLSDFAYIPANKVSIVIDEYEKITGEKIDPTMMLLTQLSLYTAIINFNLDYHDKDSANAVKNLTFKTIEHLNKLSHITESTFQNVGNLPAMEGVN